MLKEIKSFVYNHAHGLFAISVAANIPIALLCGGIIISTPLMNKFVKPLDLKPVEQVVNNVNNQYFLSKRDVIKTYNNRLLQAKTTNKPVETNITTKDLIVSSSVPFDDNIILSSNSVTSSYPNLCSQLLDKMKTIYQNRLETINNRINSNRGIDYDSLFNVKSFNDKPILQQAKNDFLNKIRETYKASQQGPIFLFVTFCSWWILCVISMFVCMELDCRAIATINNENLTHKTSKYHHHYSVK